MQSTDDSAAASSTSVSASVGRKCGYGRAEKLAVRAVGDGDDISRMSSLVKASARADELDDSAGIESSKRDWDDCDAD
jgi:hypothetical protein